MSMPELQKSQNRVWIGFVVVLFFCYFEHETQSSLNDKLFKRIDDNKYELRRFERDFAIAVDKRFVIRNEVMPSALKGRK